MGMVHNSSIWMIQPQTTECCVHTLFINNHKLVLEECFSVSPTY